MRNMEEIRICHVVPHDNQDEYASVWKELAHTVANEYARVSGGEITVDAGGFVTKVRPFGFLPCIGFWAFTAEFTNPVDAQDVVMIVNSDETYRKPTGEVRPGEILRAIRTAIKPRKFDEEIDEEVDEAGGEEPCPVCLRNKRIIANRCGHILCAKCSNTVLKCPTCRKNWYDLTRLFT